MHTDNIEVIAVRNKYRWYICNDESFSRKKLPIKVAVIKLHAFPLWREKMHTKSDLAITAKTKRCMMRSRITCARYYHLWYFVCMSNYYNFFFWKMKKKWIVVVLCNNDVLSRRRTARWAGFRVIKTERTRLWQGLANII